jgi:hypothetical protein
MKLSINTRVAAFALVFLAGCASWADVKPIARTVNDIARELCEATMGAEAERQGISVADLCAIPYIVAPFLEAQREALAAAKLGGPAPECMP